jgi:hypothetical protein
MMVYKKNVLLAVKLTVIRGTETGEHHLDVWNALDLTGWTVKSILKNREKIKEYERMVLRFVVCHFYVCVVNVTYFVDTVVFFMCINMFVSRHALLMVCYHVACYVEQYRRYHVMYLNTTVKLVKR